jgi:hypothetical protein
VSKYCPNGAVNNNNFKGCGRIWEETALPWIALKALTLFKINLDLVVFHKRDHEVKVKEARQDRQRG